MRAVKGIVCVVVVVVVSACGCGGGSAGPAADALTGDAGTGLASPDTDASTAVGSTEDPPRTRFVSGSRLQVEHWVGGSLAVPRRFWDTEFDSPCEVRTLGAAKRCVPYSELTEQLQVGFGDEQCSQAVVAESAGLHEGDIIVAGSFPLSENQPYRVGSSIADGPVYLYCQPGSTPQPDGVQKRRALVPIAESELVRFDELTSPFDEDLRLVWLRGSDGSALIEEVRVGEEVVCLPGDGFCILNSESAVQALFFDLGYVDGACTERAIRGDHGTTTACGPEGTPVYLQDECGSLSPLGRLGGKATWPGYARDPAGTCSLLAVSSTMGSPGALGEAGCLQRVEPLDEPAPQVFEERVVQDGPLELRQWEIAGGTVVAAELRLSDEATPCAAAWSGGVLRCLPPVRYVSPVTTAAGTGGSFVDHDICPELAQGAGYTTVPLYTFAAGAPCFALVSQSNAEDSMAPFSRVPIVSEVDRFVPHGGQVFQWSAGAFYVCTELPATGFFTVEPIDATTFPVLQTERR